MFEERHQREIRRRRIVEQRILDVDLSHSGPWLVAEEDVVRRDDAVHEERRKEKDEVINGERDERDAMFPKRPQSA